MADNREGVGDSRAPSISKLQKQVLSLVVRRFESTVEKPIDEVVLKVLSKRRKKWRRRHHLTPREAQFRSPDPALREEKEQLTDRFYQTGEQLLTCRRRSYALARQLEREKRELQLQARESHLHTLARLHQSLSAGDSACEPATGGKEADDQILKDLQLALSQSDALAKIRQMKLTMTPRCPPVHRRTSPGDTTQDQFGLSLLVEPLPDMPEALGEVLDVPTANTTASLPPLSEESLSPHTHTLVESQPNSKGDSGVELVDQVHGTNGNEMYEELGPVEVVPVAEDQCEGFYEELGSPSSEHLPRIACVMSLTEGQDTASVVEVMAENDTVIETQSSMYQDLEEVANNSHNSSMDERLDPENALPLVPEKEEIVSTTPDLNTISNDEDLAMVEMIMKDSELAAWIAKARLRPRPPVNYNETNRRRSRSRSSSVHE